MMVKAEQQFCGNVFLNGLPAHHTPPHTPPYKMTDKRCEECGQTIDYPSGYYTQNGRVWHSSCVEFIPNEGRRKALSGHIWGKLDDGSYGWIEP